METTSSGNRAGLVIMGILMILAGIFLIGTRVYTSFVSVYFLGIVLAIVGIVQIVQAFFRGSVGGFFLSLFVGILSLIIGGFIMMNPSATLLTLTWFLAVLLFVVGLFQFFYGLFARPLQWETIVLGIINFVLALLIYNRWPVSGLTAFGWILGVSFLATGVASVIHGFSREEDSVVQPTADGVVTYSSQIKKPKNKDY